MRTLPGCPTAAPFASGLPPRGRRAQSHPRWCRPRCRQKWLLQRNWRVPGLRVWMRTIWHHRLQRRRRWTGAGLPRCLWRFPVADSLGFLLWHEGGSLTDRSLCWPKLSRPLLQVHCHHHLPLLPLLPPSRVTMTDEDSSPPQPPASPPWPQAHPSPLPCSTSMPRPAAGSPHATACCRPPPPRRRRRRQPAPASAVHRPASRSSPGPATGQAAGPANPRRTALLECPPRPLRACPRGHPSLQQQRRTRQPRRRQGGRNGIGWAQRLLEAAVMATSPEALISGQVCRMFSRWRCLPTVCRLCRCVLRDQRGGGF